MNNVIFFICFLITCFTITPSFAEKTGNEQEIKNKNNSLIVFTGKLSCSLSRPVIMPFTGVFTNIRVTPGQLLKKGELIAQYDLDESRAIQLGRDILFNELDDLRRYLEIEKQKIRRLERKERELKQLTTENLSPQYMLDTLQTELKLTRAYIAILQKRSAYAKTFSNKTLDEIRKALGSETLLPGDIPETVWLKSPISGMVLSLHPQLRKDSLLPEGTVIATIGVMETMLIHSLVYERDVVYLNPGDPVKFYPESLSGKSFPATITSINWIPETSDPSIPSYYRVEMTLTNSNLDLRAGFKGRIEYQQKMK